MLFYFWFVDVVLIISEEFFEIFPQEGFHNVFDFDCSVSEVVIHFKVLKPPNSYLSHIFHKSEVVKVFEDMIGTFPILLHV